MASHALSSGIGLPPSTFELLDGASNSADSLTTLTLLYNQLINIVAPATPAGLKMMQEDKLHHPRLHIIAPIPSMRLLLLVAFIFMAIFLRMSLYRDVDSATVSLNLLDQSGDTLLRVLLFLSSAAGLGAAFGALFDAYGYVVEGRFESSMDSLYWSRIGLGLVSGLLLAELMPIGPHGNAWQRPLLALLGGFSAPVVHMIMQGLVAKLESVFSPGAQQPQRVAPSLLREALAEEKALRAPVRPAPGRPRPSESVGAIDEPATPANPLQAVAPSAQRLTPR